MTTEKKLREIINQIYIRMYKEATPSVDFLKLIRTKEVSEPNWFMRYHLDSDRQVEIIELFCKKNHLTKRESSLVSQAVHLGCSPNSSDKKD